MPEIEIYTWAHCPYCQRAKALLDSKGVEYTEYEISGDNEAHAAMVERGSDGVTSVPQIFIDNVHIPGGNSKLQELERAGELDALIFGNNGNNNGNPKNGFGPT